MHNQSIKDALAEFGAAGKAYRWAHDPLPCKQDPTGLADQSGLVLSVMSQGTMATILRGSHGI